MTRTLPASRASRRAFLRRATSLSMAGIAAPWALNLAALGEAAAATAADYKALVCVFLYGGNDYGNTLIPYDSASYALYQGQRPTLAYARSALDATALNPTAAPLDAGGFARQYALAPELAPLLPIFNAGRMGALLNVGTLVQPTTIGPTEEPMRLRQKLSSAVAVARPRSLASCCAAAKVGA